jgi:hypothetical protein
VRRRRRKLFQTPGEAGTFVPRRRRFLTPEEREDQEIRSEAVDRMLSDRL